MVLVVTDKVGSTRGIELKPLQGVMVVTEEGNSAYLNQEHIDCLIEMERKQMFDEAVRDMIKSLELNEDAEYKEPTTKNYLGVDCIDKSTECKHKCIDNDLGVDYIKKSDAIDIIQDMHGLARADVISDAVNRIITMPSVTPQEPKKGYWTYIRNSEVNGLKIVECSECGKRTYGSGNYCPNCGAKMGEPQESEEE